jgi:adenylate cyclase class 2
MFEVEIKAAAQVRPLADRLRDAGAIFEKRTKQSDTYYNAPDRDFGSTDEALRIRVQDGKAYLTYKGKKVDAGSKTRKEVEVEVGDRAKMEDVLLSLGFTKTLKVHKEREIYHYKGVEISLDRVDGLGEFVEAEARAEHESEIEGRREGLVAVLRGLGVDGELIRDSYIEMLLKKRPA